MSGMSVTGIDCIGQARTSFALAFFKSDFECMCDINTYRDGNLNLN